MAKKKKKAAPKKVAKRASTSPRKKARVKTAAAKSPSSQQTYEQLRGRFMGTKKKIAPKGDAARGSSDVYTDAEAIVAAEMPGVKIVHLPKGPATDAAQTATVHGASLNDLKRKYVGHNSPRNSADADATLQVRSQVVFVEPEGETADQQMGPKAVIVRDGRVRGFQG